MVVLYNVLSVQWLYYTIHSPHYTTHHATASRGGAWDLKLIILSLLFHNNQEIDLKKVFVMIQRSTWYVLNFKSHAQSL